MPDSILFAYLTAKDRGEAETIGRALVTGGLAACANILEGMKSIYRWEGNMEEASEVVVILKTTSAHCEAIVSQVKALHSYEVPCLVFLPVTSGNPDYLEWVTRNVSQPPQTP